MREGRGGVCEEGKGQYTHAHTVIRLVGGKRRRRRRGVFSTNARREKSKKRGRQLPNPPFSTQPASPSSSNAHPRKVVAVPREIWRPRRLEWRPARAARAMQPSEDPCRDHRGRATASGCREENGGPRPMHTECKKGARTVSQKGCEATLCFTPHCEQFVFRRVSPPPLPRARLPHTRHTFTSHSQCRGSCLARRRCC